LEQETRRPVETALKQRCGPKPEEFLVGSIRARPHQAADADVASAHACGAWSRIASTHDRRIISKRDIQANPLPVRLKKMS